MDNLDQLLKNSEKTMSQVVESWDKNMAKIRTGKANNSMLDSVIVNYYGTPTPLLQLAQVNTPEPNIITVRPYDRQQMSEFVGGINRANLGLTPVADAEIIRITIPPLTEQVRKDSVKKMWKELENFKVHIRNERRYFIDKVKKSDLSEDVVKEAEKHIQDLTNKYTKMLDNKTKDKEKTLMTI
ncbi:ribosome recycling factor [Entomoplasma freundtii]|uniref:Ribosome-recycling factor n=1 Tax=Entomoplasma freundtii TaxID=74700 RepID=A0A2K8NV85_9MOLU|nr:ribosome recycling factor [Entomoplasma freundtii]ATZ16543.1 ribosome recycling factor [Entomoplasma freundtii]TDY58291.1 ribosome recycling factor [Entomoplasma freundtii]